MDCRKRVFWSLALLGGLAGCTTTGTNTAQTTTPVPNNPPTQIAQIDPALIKKADEQPTQTPPAKLCVVWGKLAADEAATMGGSSVEANDKRDRARKAYNQAIRIDPKNLDAYLGLAKLYMAMDEDEHAITTLTTASKQHPEAAGVWFMLGMVYSKRKSWDPAVDYFGRAAQLEPENRTYVDTLGHVLARAGRTQEALQAYLRVNSEAQAYFKVARMMQHLNKTEQSRQYAQLALQKDPRLQEAQELLTQLNDGGATGLAQTSFTQP